MAGSIIRGAYWSQKILLGDLFFGALRMLKLTDDVRKDILQRLTEGESLRSACRAHNVSAGSFIDAIHRDEELFERYMRARESGIDAQAEEMHDLEFRVLSGDLDPQAFRVAMEARKWRMARQHPKKYGDKQSVEQTTTLSGSVSVSATLSPELQSMVDSVYSAAKGD